MNGNVETRSFDDILDALSNLQRRRLLVALLDHNPQDDAPTVVVDDGSENRRPALVRMHHVHLPKLESYGFIEWDRENGEVSKGPEFEEVGPLLELLERQGDELPAEWL